MPQTNGTPAQGLIFGQVGSRPPSGAGGGGDTSSSTPNALLISNPTPAPFHTMEPPPGGEDPVMELQFDFPQQNDFAWFARPFTRPYVVYVMTLT